MVIGLYPCRGSAIARIVGVNVQEHKEFHTAVKMWVFEEMVDGRKLTEIINEQHENTKYLPGFKIPENVVRTCTSVICSLGTWPGLHCKSL